MQCEPRSLHAVKRWLVPAPLRTLTPGRGPGGAKEATVCRGGGPSSSCGGPSRNRSGVKAFPREQVRRVEQSGRSVVLVVGVAEPELLQDVCGRSVLRVMTREERARGELFECEAHDRCCRLGGE